MANQKKIQLWKDEAQVFLDTDSITSSDGAKNLTTLLSEKQPELTSETTLFSYKVGSNGAPSDLKFGGTLTLPEGGSGSGDENVIETVKVNGTAITVTNKAVDIDLSGYQQAEQAKGLSSNDYDDASKAKLDSLFPAKYVYATSSEEASVVYNKIRSAIVNIEVASEITISIPPTLIYHTDTTRAICPLSVSDYGYSYAFSGVYGTPDSLIQIVITSNNISTFELRVTD